MEWKYGSLDRDEPQNSYYIVDNETGVGIAVAEETIGQFTGLYDKNKAPIYEGDIVSIKYNEGCIVKGAIEYRAYGFYIITNCNDWELNFFAEIEVIGNVWDNPDLLGE